MIRSLHVLGSRELGGADRFFIRLVEGLHDAGHPVLAVVRGDGPVARVLRPDVPQLALPLASKWDLWSRWRLGRLIRAWQPDVVQTYMGRATRLTRLPAGSPAVHIARLGGFYKIRGYYEHAHAWVGNTQAICAHLREAGLPAEAIFHLGNFVPEPRPVPAAERAALRAQLGLPPEARVLLALGRMVEKKGFADLLDAFERLPGRSAEGAPLRLLLVGDGPERAALEARAGQGSLRGRVVLAGWQDEPTPFYAAADAFVCPSRHEPLGNVILEAWTHGLPVLSTDNEGAQELITPGHDGLIAPRADPAGLAAGLEHLLLGLDAAGRAALAAAGRATVHREHGAPAVIGAYLALYQRLIDARRSTPAGPPAAQP